MDNYRAVYDAVESAMRNADIGHYFMLAGEALSHALDDFQRPSVLYRPDVGLDGNKYSVLYGANLMEGCVGFGDTLAEAMADFDKNWREQKAPTPNEEMAEKARAELAKERATS